MRWKVNICSNKQKQRHQISTSCNTKGWSLRLFWIFFLLFDKKQPSTVKKDKMV